MGEPIAGSPDSIPTKVLYAIELYGQVKDPLSSVNM